MNGDLKMALGGVGALIFAYLVIANGTQFGAVTNSIAQSSASVISTLQGRGGTSGGAISSPVVMA